MDREKPVCHSVRLPGYVSLFVFELDAASGALIANRIGIQFSSAVRADPKAILAHIFCPLDRISALHGVHPVVFLSDA